jgi:hypothetical protein
MPDSFAKAQARNDDSEHPDFWLDDRAEAFREAIAEECARQLAECHEMSASFIADKIRGKHVLLMRNPVEFKVACLQMMLDGSDEFLPLLIRTALEVADQRTSEGLSVQEIVAKTLRSYTEPLPVPCEVGP